MLMEGCVSCFKRNTTAALQDFTGRLEGRVNALRKSAVYIG